MPLTFTYEETTWKSSREVKRNMPTISFHNMDASKYICEHDIFVSKIYLWAKHIYEKNISMSKIYLWAIYIYNININHDFYSHNIPGICMTNSLLYMCDWSVKHGCRCSSVLCWHGGSTKIPNCQNFFIPHILEIIPLKLNHTM